MVPQILVLGHDAASMAAARNAIEASGWVPVLPASGESSCRAIERVLPAYVLIDTLHDSASDIAFYLTVTQCRARALLYGTTESTLIMRRLAVRFGVVTIDVAYGTHEFADAIVHRLDAEEWLAGWLYTRRSVTGSVPVVGHSGTLES